MFPYGELIQTLFQTRFRARTIAKKYKRVIVIKIA